MRQATIALAAVALAFVGPVTSLWAQAAGEVRLKIAKAGALVGAGADGIRKASSMKADEMISVAFHLAYNFGLAYVVGLCPRSLDE